MSDIFAADLRPTKPAAVAAFLSTRFGATVAADDVRMLTSFRFDDPAGEVGCETHIVGVSLPGRGDVVVQVPLTYRGAPLGGASEAALVTTMDHSVLGERWVYDAAHDPIYVTELLLSITDAGSAAQQFAVADDGSRALITEGLANVRGTGPASDPVDLPDPREVSGCADDDVQADGSVLPAVEREGDRSVTRLRGTAIELVDVLDMDSGLPGGEAADLGSAVVDAGQLVATWDGQDSPVVLARIVR